MFAAAGVVRGGWWRYLAQLLQSLGVFVRTAVIGPFGQGEIAAGYVAGVLSLGDAALLVAAAGQVDAGPLAGAVG